MFKFILLISINAGACLNNSTTKELYPLIINAIENSHFEEMKPCDILLINQDLDFEYLTDNSTLVSMKFGKLSNYDIGM